MNSPKQNVYESSPSLDTESKRLRSFDIPSRFSTEVLGAIPAGATVLDIGSGENPALNSYVDEQDGHYIAFDFRTDAVSEQLGYGAIAVRGDALALPFQAESVDIAHSRFVLAHFPAEKRAVMIDEIIDTLTPEGKAVLIDYDWSAMHGSPVFNRLRDFTINNISLFEADYGASSAEEIAQFTGDKATVTETDRQHSPHLFDYGPALTIRQVTLAGLERQGSAQELIDEANAIFDELESEANSENPPGFYMPDMVAVTLQK